MAARKDEDPTALPVDYSNKLPENSRLTKVCINTLDSDGSVTFYDKVLGLTPAGERNFTLDQADLRLCDEAEEGAASDLGWSFFTVNVQSSQAIEALMVHLEQLGHEFFVDNKRSILSLFDQNGIEWWFTKK